MSNDLKYCTCGCGQALGADPRAKYASGACRLRAHRRRNVTSVTPGERDITPTSDPLHDPLHNPSVTFVTGDTLYTPELYEDGSSYGDLPKGLTYKETVTELKRQIQEVIKRDVDWIEENNKEIQWLKEVTERLSAERTFWRNQVGQSYTASSRSNDKYSDLVKFLDENPDGLRTVRAALSTKYHEDHNPGIDRRYMQQINAAFDKIKGKS